MADLMCLGTCGTNDPTKAAFPFITANGAVANKTDVVIALLGEATYLMKDEIAQTVHPVGFPPFTDILEDVKKHEIPIYV